MWSVIDGPPPDKCLWRVLPKSKDETSPKFLPWVSVGRFL